MMGASYGLESVSQATLDRVLDALPRLTALIKDATVHEAVTAKNLTAVLARLKELQQNYEAETEGKRAAMFAAGDPRFEDGMLAPLVLKGINSMLAINI